MAAYAKRFGLLSVNRLCNFLKKRILYLTIFEDDDGDDDNDDKLYFSVRSSSWPCKAY